MASKIFTASLRAMRPVQWIKNCIVFAAAVFASRLDLHTLFYGAVAFLSFSMVASAVYIVNDIFDAHADRNHPKKKLRPIAAGDITAPFAIVLAAFCFSLGLLLSFGVTPAFTGVIVAYLILQVLYNAYFKHQPILDVMSIAAGFVLRALGGAYAVRVEPSIWFVLCVGLLALYLGIEKRKAEFVAMGSEGSTRKVLQFYTLTWLNKMEGIVTSSILMTYALWSIRPEAGKWMIVSLVFVIYGLFKYQHLSEQGKGEAPEMTLVKSPALLVNIALWLLTCIAVLRFSPAAPTK